MAAVRSDTGLELLTIGQPSSGNRQGVKNSVQIKDITGGIIDRNVWYFPGRWQPDRQYTRTDEIGHDALEDEETNDNTSEEEEE